MHTKHTHLLLCRVLMVQPANALSARMFLESQYAVKYWWLPNGGCPTQMDRHIRLSSSPTQSSFSPSIFAPIHALVYSSKRINERIDREACQIWPSLLTLHSPLYLVERKKFCKSYKTDEGVSFHPFTPSYTYWKLAIKTEMWAMKKSHRPCPLAIPLLTLPHHVKNLHSKL